MSRVVFTKLIVWAIFAVAGFFCGSVTGGAPPYGAGSEVAGHIGAFAGLAGGIIWTRMVPAGGKVRRAMLVGGIVGADCHVIVYICVSAYLMLFYLDVYLPAILLALLPISFAVGALVGLVAFGLWGVFGTPSEKSRFP